MENPRSSRIWLCPQVRAALRFSLALLFVGRGGFLYVWEALEEEHYFRGRSLGLGWHFWLPVLRGSAWFL